MAQIVASGRGRILLHEGYRYQRNKTSRDLLALHSGTLSGISINEHIRYE